LHDEEEQEIGLNGKLINLAPYPLRMRRVQEGSIGNKKKRKICF
jgi:hypothetical protein